MKAPLLSLLLLGSCWWSGTAVAQSTISNGTFETWTTGSGIGVDVPTQWVTSDQIADNLIGLGLGTV